MSVTLYTFNKGGYLINVVRDDTTLNYIDAFSRFNGLPDTSQPPPDVIISNVCQSGTTTLYSYFSITLYPYARAVVTLNSPYCGFVPIPCDIAIKSLVTTPESSSNDDATVTIFATTSNGEITYGIYEPPYGELTTNTTGIFTGLIPGNYTAVVSDERLCVATQIFVIEPFDTTKTNFKYRLAFTDITGTISWELRLLDMLHVYDDLLYPIDVTGSTGSPVIKTTANQSEDKTEPIIPTILDIKLLFTGLDFTISELTDVPEQAWGVQLYKNGEIDFQGWLLPDQTQDYYMDAPYEVSFQASDGLPSLKGKVFGNGSGGQGYSNFQIQQYGLTTWGSLVKQCLDQLGYDYGETVIISSLTFNNAYNSELWLEISTWSDILYDSSAVAMDTYSALSLLLSSMKLSIFQHGGRFFLVNYNDLSYINNSLRIASYEASFYQLSHDFESVIFTSFSVEKPIIQPVGHEWSNQPINPPQSLTYDKQYNIEVDISFATLALLFTNPSFEIGAVQGVKPSVLSVGPSYTDLQLFYNYDPVIDGVVGSGAYDGDWELALRSFVVLPIATAVFDFGTFITPFIVDQPNKLMNVSVQFRPYVVGTINTCPAIGMVFTGVSGEIYIFNVLTNNWDQKPTQNLTSYTFTDYKNMTSNKIRTTDFIAWQNFTIKSTAFPEISGTCNIVIFAFSYYIANGVSIPTGVSNLDPIKIDYDLLELTIQDSQPVSTLQTGESHYETGITLFPAAELKTVTQGLFTYPNNKRGAGNVFNINDYTTGQVANLWNFATHNADRLDRLPGTISRAIARNYGRQMYIFEGDVSGMQMQFYSMFVLKHYESKILAPFSVALDCRNNKAHIIIVEVDDSDAQFIYTYTAIYANNARQNTTSNSGS